MTHFLPILFYLAAGFSLRFYRRFSDTASAALNTFVIYLSLPALVLVEIHRIVRETELSSKIIIPAAMPWIIFGCAAVIMLGMARKFGWSRKLTGCLVLTAGLGNTSFVGFPLLESLLGPSSLPTAIVIDQLGTFLVLSVLGLVTAALFAARATSLKGMPTKSMQPKNILLRIFTFPPLLAVVFAFLTAHFIYSDEIVSNLQKLAGTLIPLALVSVGTQLKFNLSELKKFKIPLLIGLSFKLLLAPLVTLIACHWLLPQNSIEFTVTVLEAGMAPMITAAVVASEEGLEPELASLMIGIGIPLSLITVPAWLWLLTRVGIA